MSKETESPVLAPPRLPAPPKKWTFSDVNASVPHDWMAAEVVVFDKARGHNYAVTRIALHRNRSGKKVVVLYTTQTQSREDET